MSSHRPDTSPVVYSIGHSNHSIERFLELLRLHRVEVLVDVRSKPYSSYSPHFSREALESAVTAVGLRYLYLGEKLGGRPEEEQVYDGQRADYERVAAIPRFQDGIECLLREAGQYRVAVMCSEEAPKRCHRYRSIRPELQKRGVEMRHIRGDGRVEDDVGLHGGQLSMFLSGEEPGWKSIPLGSRKRRRRTSSEP